MGILFIGHSFLYDKDRSNKEDRPLTREDAKKIVNKLTDEEVDKVYQFLMQLKEKKASVKE